MVINKKDNVEVNLADGHKYALKDISKPIGISKYNLIQAIPEDLKPNLPTVEEIEKEITEKIATDDNK